MLPVLRFGPFQLDLENEQLRQGTGAIHLRPKSFAVLRYLAEHPGRLITKETLLEAVWPGVVVSESVLAVCVSELRTALGDRAQSRRYIETASRRGYRFIGASARPGLAPSAPLPGGHAEPPVRPVVGRRAELARLRGWWEAALRGERQVVFVTGEPGIGKSTVVDAFVAQVADPQETWSARGQCIEHYGVGEPYLSVLDALARLCRGHAGRTRHGGLAPLGTDLAGADALVPRRGRAGRPRAPRARVHSRPHVARAGGGRGGLVPGAPGAPGARGSALERWSHGGPPGLARPAPGDRTAAAHRQLSSGGRNRGRAPAAGRHRGTGAAPVLRGTGGGAAHGRRHRRVPVGPASPPNWP